MDHRGTPSDPDRPLKGFDGPVCGMGGMDPHNRQVTEEDETKKDRTMKASVFFCVFLCVFVLFMGWCLGGYFRLRQERISSLGSSLGSLCLGGLDSLCLAPG